jgi:hypothetical protein
MNADRWGTQARSAASPELPVSFYLAGVSDPSEIARLDPDADHDAFRPGELSWVAQTFLRLRAAGYPVALTSAAPERGLVVFHAKHKHDLARSAKGRRDLVYVAIRADNSSPLLADFEVLQSGRFADGRNRFWIPFWPQPGLQPRDPARGTRLERVAYMGRIENLHPAFRGDDWRRALEGLGLEWVLREVRFERASKSQRRPRREMAPPIDWEDYRELDAVLAVRPHEPELEFAKPASKLINAWRAGVPALVGPEFACREIRRSVDDFIEVSDANEALDGLRRLRDDPALYSRMVAAGRARVDEFSFAALTERWAELLFETVPERLAGGALPWSHRLPIPLRLPVRRGLRWLRAARSR